MVIGSDDSDNDYPSDDANDNDYEANSENVLNVNDHNVMHQEQFDALVNVLESQSSYNRSRYDDAPLNEQNNSQMTDSPLSRYVQSVNQSKNSKSKNTVAQKPPSKNPTTTNANRFENESLVDFPGEHPEDDETEIDR